RTTNEEPSIMKTMVPRMWFAGSVVVDYEDDGASFVVCKISGQPDVRNTVIPRGEGDPNKGFGDCDLVRTWIRRVNFVTRVSKSRGFR
ncbi:hypothetical protein U1Q18_002610, partial [Sarracenia purpurea var. burkii]